MVVSGFLLHPGELVSYGLDGGYLGICRLSRRWWLPTRVPGGETDGAVRRVRLVLRIEGGSGVGIMPSSYLCFLWVDLSLSWLVEVVEEASRRVTCLFGVDLGLSWVEGVATRKVTCGSCEWSSWGLVARRPGRGISCPEGVDAVHRSWHSVGEPSCSLANELNE